MEETKVQAQEITTGKGKDKGKGKAQAQAKKEAAKACKVTLEKNFLATFPEFKEVFKKFNVRRIEFSYTDKATKKDVTSWFKVNGLLTQGFTDAK